MQQDILEPPSFDFLPPARGSARSHFNSILRFVVYPFLLYTASVFLLTFPLMLDFNSAYLTTEGDGYQMIWDIWWVRHAIVTLHQSPFYTNMVHAPGGVSLWLHSLHVANGLISIPLRLVFTEIQTFNIIWLLAYAGSGLTAFWLCFAVTRRYWPSMAGGFVFAFCSYRWAHYYGHLNLISTEWLPLFFLGLLQLFRRPNVGIALAVAATLLIILLTDQYQFMDCGLSVIVILAWLLFSGRYRELLQRRYLITASILLLTVIAICGPIIWAMKRATLAGPLVNEHDAERFSADMVGPWVPDWTWQYNGLTHAVWHWWVYNSYEKSVCLGPFAVIAAVVGLWKIQQKAVDDEPRFRLGSATLFATLAVTFILLSYGPTWRFWTIDVTRITPYRALMFICPPVRFAGNPGRLIIVAQLAVAVLSAAGLSRLRYINSSGWRTAITFLFVLGFVTESEPRTLVSRSPDAPKWAEFLRDDPRPGGVINMQHGGESIDLYLQTIHHRAIARGALSRTPNDVARATDVVMNDVIENKFAELSNMGFAFLVQSDLAPQLPLHGEYSDRYVRVYRLSADR